MPFAPRKEEVAAVATAIEDEESLEAVAKVALKTAFALLQERQMYAVATDAMVLYAPYASETDAYNALAAGKVPGYEDEEGIKAIRKEGAIPTLGGKATVLKVVGPGLAQRKQEEKDKEARLVAGHLCATCEHPVAAHGLITRSTGCSFTGCRCKTPKTP